MIFYFSHHAPRRHQSLSRQRGVVLLVSLLFLIVLTLLGVAASRMVTGEEKMSRYLREYNTAFQAAEAAMRDARDDIDGILATGGTYASRFDSKTSYFADCSFGQCKYDASELTPPWQSEAKWANAAVYGTYSRRSALPKSGSVGTNASTTAKDENEADVARFDAGTATSVVTGVWKQPAYLVEAVPDDRVGADSVVVGSNAVPFLYRITSRGYGADPNSVAMVQEIYSAPAPTARN
jgi:type IV pilus assembly protein PilX